MIPRGRFAPAAGGGTIGTLVNFEVQTGGHTNFVNGTGFTLAVRWIDGVAPAGFPAMFDFAWSACGRENNGGLFQNFLGTFTSGGALTVGNPHCMVFAIDTTNGLPGGRCISVYVDGSDYMSDTTTQSSQTLFFDDADHPLSFGEGAATVQLDTNGVWMTDQAMDPAAVYSLFFDGSEQFQPLPTNGVVNGVTPKFWQNGDAPAWNSLSDNNSNSYTLSGSVT